MLPDKDSLRIKYVQGQIGVEIASRWLSTRSWVEKVEVIEREEEWFYKGDIRFWRDGAPFTLELKYEMYHALTRDSRWTPHLAVEWWLDDGRRQASIGIQECRGNYYGHLYMDGVFCVGTPPRIRQWIRINKRQLRTFSVPTGYKGKTKIGYLLPRQKLIDEGILKQYTEVH